MSKNSQIGRNKKRNPSSVRYTNEQRWIKNKINKLKKHIKKHPNDVQSAKQTVPTNYMRKKSYTFFELLAMSKLDKEKILCKTN